MFGLRSTVNCLHRSIHTAFETTPQILHTTPRCSLPTGTLLELLLRRSGPVTATVFRGGNAMRPDVPFLGSSRDSYRTGWMYSCSIRNCICSTSSFYRVSKRHPIRSIHTYQNPMPKLTSVDGRILPLPLSPRSPLPTHILATPDRHGRPWYRFLTFYEFLAPRSSLQPRLANNKQSAANKTTLSPRAATTNVLAQPVASDLIPLDLLPRHRQLSP